MTSSEKIQVQVGSRIRISGPVSPWLHKQLVNQLTIPNPVYMENEKYGRFNRGVKKTLCYLWNRKGVLFVPRGFARQLIRILNSADIPYDLSDKTRSMEILDVSFSGMLYDFQKETAQKILSRRFGVVQLPTGAGKTVLALHCIAMRAQPACVVVHTKELLHQWKERALEFLDLSDESIGLVGDGKYQMGRPLTICLVHSLYKRASEVAKTTGNLVVDECHRIPSRTFTDAVQAFDSRFMLGLSATPYRRDGLTPLIHWYMGDKLVEVNPADLQSKGKLIQANLVVRKTNFAYPYEDDYQSMLTMLAQDSKRSNMIADDIARYVAETNGSCLVVSDRKQHCQELYQRIVNRGIKAELLTGATPVKRRKEIVTALNQGQVKVLVSTLQLIGEGFDSKNLSALFLATPVRFSGRVLQIVGRILRTGTDKYEGTIFDYVDEPGVLRSSFNSRLHTYQKIGVRIDETELLQEHLQNR